MRCEALAGMLMSPARAGRPMKQRIALLLVLGLVGVAGSAAAVGVGVGPVGVQCTGPAVAFALGVPPKLNVTPPSCTVTGLPV